MGDRSKLPANVGTIGSEIMANAVRYEREKRLLGDNDMASDSAQGERLGERAPPHKDILRGCSIKCVHGAQVDEQKAILARGSTLTCDTMAILALELATEQELLWQNT